MTGNSYSECPECGSGALSTKSVSITTDRSSLESEWDYCIECEWEDK